MRPTTTPDLKVGQIWKRGDAVGTAVAITDLWTTAAGQAVAFLYVASGNRDRLTAAEFRSRYSRLVADARTVAEQAKEVAPDDF